MAAEEVVGDWAAQEGDQEPGQTCPGCVPFAVAESPATVPAGAEEGAVATGVAEAGPAGEMGAAGGRL
jgi:hypothetical protein